MQEKEFILVSLRDTVHIAKEGMVIGVMQELEVADHIVSVVRKLRDECWG